MMFINNVIEENIFCFHPIISRTIFLEKTWEHSYFENSFKYIILAKKFLTQTLQNLIVKKGLSISIPYNPENKPGAYFWSKHFFGLIFGGGAYFLDEIRVRKEDGLIIEGCISATVIKGIRIISL